MSVARSSMYIVLVYNNRKDIIANFDCKASQAVDSSSMRQGWARLSQKTVRYHDLAEGGFGYFDTGTPRAWKRRPLIRRPEC